MKLRFLAALAAMLAIAGTASAQTPAERGEYLVNSIAGCGNCHTPLGPNGFVMDQHLAGRPMAVEEMMSPVASNITQDKETGIGSWTDEQIITAIREGKRPDGSLIGPPMPFELYRDLSDSDVKAIVAYLRTVKPVKNELPKSTYKFPLPPAYGPPVESVADVPRDDKVKYGEYLAGPMGHCIECHTPMVKGRRDFENQLGAGGFEFHGPWGVSVAANITSHPEDGITEFSDADLAKMIQQGVRPDGSKMAPPMGYFWYKNISEEDMDALIAYLRTIPPKPLPE